MNYNEKLHSSNLRRGEDGQFYMKNISAYWLPDIRLKKEISGTIYTVSGSYEGTTTLDRKLRRILLQGGDIHDK